LKPNACLPKSSLFALLALSFFLTYSCRAQDNYEIQVYPSETVARGRTMVELHSNFTFKGSKEKVDGVEPTNHALHETLEITQGITSNFEIGFYVFTSVRSGLGWDWVGDHIRPRISIPKSWHWPVGVSISSEIGYQRPIYSANTWSVEIRPIIDKELGRWYLSFNPTFERAIKGPDESRGFEFSPNLKVGYDFTRKISGGFEYYGALGPVSSIDPGREQEHQIFPVIDLNLSPDWEINFGIGFGLTGRTDHLILKLILGRRFKIKT
jgi:hypothetical protein